MDDELREQYEAVREMAEEVRQRCFDGSGHLVAVVQSKGGTPVTNPYLVEWHRLMGEARSLAARLGISEADGPVGPLVEATESGDADRQLAELTRELAEEIERTTGHGKAALCRVYLDAVRELRALRGEAAPGGNVAAIIGRKANPNGRRLSVV